MFFPTAGYKASLACVQLPRAERVTNQLFYNCTTDDLGSCSNLFTAVDVSAVVMGETAM